MRCPIPWVSEITGQQVFYVNEAMDAFDKLLSENKINKPVRVFSIGAYRVRGVGHGFLYVTDLTNVEICSSISGWQVAFSSDDIGVPFTYGLFFARNYEGMKFMETLQLREPLFHLINAVNYVKDSKLFNLIDEEQHWMELAQKDLWFGNRYLGLVAFRTSCGKKMTLAEYRGLRGSSCFFYYAEIDSEFERLPATGSILENGNYVFVVSRQMSLLLKKQIGFPKYNIWFSDVKNSPVLALNLVQARRSGRHKHNLKSIEQIVEEITKGTLTISAATKQVLRGMHYSSCLRPCNGRECRTRQKAQMEMHIMRLATASMEETCTRTPSQLEYLSPSESVRRKMEEFLKINSWDKDYPERVLKCD